MSHILFGSSDIYGHGKGVMGDGCCPMDRIGTVHNQCPVDRRDIEWNQKIGVTETWAAG